MSTTSRSGPLLAITGTIFMLLGLALVGGGVYLATLGGSLYYVFAGAGLAVTGFLVFRARRAALFLLAVLLLATVVWSLVEVRFDWWQLLPRLDIWFAAGVWLLLPFINRRLGPASSGRDTGRAALFASVAVTALVGVPIFAVLLRRSVA